MFTLVAFALLGLIVGSFLNVLILRYDVRSLGGRSECMSCETMIHWYDNIPLLSWIVLRGRCRHCHSRISLQYPFVELATAVLFVLIGGALGPNLYFTYFLSDIQFTLLLLTTICFLAIAALLVAIFVYDLYHTIIPDPWVYTFAALAFFSQFLIPSWGGIVELLILAGPIAALPLFLLWALSRGRWMGFGDVKLALGIGWLLGPLLGITAIFFAFIIGAVVSLPLVAFSSEAGKRLLSIFTPTHSSPKVREGFTMGSEIPFGPFLIFSCLILWFTTLYGVDLSAVPLVGSLLWSFSS